MRRVFVSSSQPIRFARFDGKSVNRGLPVLDKARALDPGLPQVRMIVCSGDENVRSAGGILRAGACFVSSAKHKFADE